MEEVDYSEFLYRPNGPEPKSREPEPSKKPKKRRKKAFTVIIALILCFAIVFLCVDFFSKGGVTDYIYSLIRRTEYRYYCVTRSYRTRESAHAGALQAEKGGGAGYLFSENGDFYVVFGVYSSESDAKKVSDKNSDTFIYTLSYKTSSTELANLIDKLVRELSIALDNVDAGIYSDGMLSTVRDNYVILFTSHNTDNEEERNLISFILSCLSGISPGTTDRTSLLFQTRHIICSILFSARTTFS